MKNKSILIVVALAFFQSSCNSQTKNSVTVVGRESAVQVKEGVYVDDYSYKGYEVQPFADLKYVMPLELGTEWLVSYLREDPENPNKNKAVIETHTIIDTISTGYYNGSETQQIAVPVFEDGSKHRAALDDMLFFKGFRKYGANEISNKDLGESYLDGVTEADYDIERDNMMYAGTYCSVTDSMPLLDGVRTREISYQFGDKKQVLLAYEIDSIGGRIEPALFMDLDLDGIPDLVYSLDNQIYEKDDKREIIKYYTSYFLFLSSEAEPGQLVKHVATKTILYSYYESYINKDEDDDEDSTNEK